MLASSHTGVAGEVSPPAGRMAWHLGHLDALRGIAVLGVVMVHSMVLHSGVILPGLSANSRMLLFSGQRGVQLFFVVSAFTLFLSRNKRAEHAPIRNFFLRRLFRLTPMFYVAVALTYFFSAEHAPPGKLLLSMVYLNGFSPATLQIGALGGWSIADEAIFYMTLPFLFRWIRSLRTALVWLAVSLPSCFVLGRLLTHRWPQDEESFTFFLMTVQWGVFMLGIVAFFVAQEIFPQFQDRRQRQTLSAVLLVLAALFYFGQLPFTNRNLFGSSAVCALLLLALSLHPWRPLVNRLTILLGRISYSLYLLHFFIIDHLRVWAEELASRHALLLRHPLLQQQIVFLGTVLLAGCGAALTWRFIEEPGILLGRRLVDRLERRAARSPSPEIPNLSETPSTPDAQF